jgi:hypothetical protein
MKKTTALGALLLCSISSIAHATAYYPAQILGRDLEARGLHWAGHVGLTFAKHFADTTESVIEVLNQIEVIQINSIQQFKKSTRYWGSRYGIADQTPAAERIIEEALKQRELCPIYTDSATFHRGQGTPDNPTRCAVFRCDTFINYLFHEAGYTLPTYHGTTLPRLVFKAFPKTHEQDNIARNTSFEAFKTAFDLPPEKTTPQTLEATWKLAQSPKLALEKQLFLLDYLGLNGAPDLITDLIDFYQKQSQPDIKSMLIRSMFTLYQTHYLNQQHPALQAFYQNILNSALRPQDIPFVIRGLVQLSSPEVLLIHQHQIQTLLQQQEKNLPPAIRSNLYKIAILRPRRLLR